jgi:hypothetical protein
MAFATAIRNDRHRLWNIKAIFDLQKNLVELEGIEPPSDFGEHCFQRVPKSCSGIELQPPKTLNHAINLAKI